MSTRYQVRKASVCDGVSTVEREFILDTETGSEVPLGDVCQTLNNGWVKGPPKRDGNFLFQLGTYTYAYSTWVFGQGGIFHNGKLHLRTEIKRHLEIDIWN